LASYKKNRVNTGSALLDIIRQKVAIRTVASLQEQLFSTPHAVPITNGSSSRKRHFEYGAVQELAEIDIAQQADNNKDFWF
jgi:hypothetical protein